MNFQFTNPNYLFLLPPALGMIVWLAVKSDVQIGPFRRWLAFLLRFVVVTSLTLALAGIQWKKPLEGMNIFFLLDRSDSIPPTQQELTRTFINKASAGKKAVDKVGVLVFGTEAAIETSPNEAAKVEKIQAVVPTERTDIAAAIRLGTAAFPETGQKRLVLLSDGNENMGEAMAAATAAKPLGVTLDVIPLGIARGNDVSVQKLGLPGEIKKGQTFEVKIFTQADAAQAATIRLYRNDQFLGEQKVQMVAGKNLFTFPQTLAEPGFYSYNVQIDAPGDLVPQNNRATAFTNVRGNPRLLVISADPKTDEPLVAALQSSRVEVKLGGINNFPATLAEMQSYDAIFISNVAAGDLGEDSMKRLESAVRDFGVGLVCIGGDQTYAAGGYRGTPLEATLPVDMELNSKKVLPSGAVAMVMHGMEFGNGNQIARDCAIGVLDALGPQDEMGVVLWNGSENWLFPMTRVGDKKELGRKIAGMNQGDLPAFQNVMAMAHKGLKDSPANLKHMIVFSDGDPNRPSSALMKSIIDDRITVTTVLIAGHAGPETMQWIADTGNGRFYDVRDPAQLPQIFIKEAAVILKSAIFEEPFKPQQAAASEILRGISAAEYPMLKGYVCTTAKPRAETPLVTDKGDPLLAHWQFGLGRAVAFTSDAKAKWATGWLSWDKYREFWTQVAQWSLRKLENADFTSEVSVDKGEGRLSVEAVDAQGNYRNFLNLETVVVSPKGETQKVRLEQTGPGHYEAVFPTREVGAYLMNLMETKNGKIQGTQALGASVNYSPEFSASEPNLNLLRRLTEVTGGKILDPQIDNPFLHNRLKTFQPQDLWEWLLKIAIVLFVFDVAIRRIQLEREQFERAARAIQRSVIFWRKEPVRVESDESLAALLARRDRVRASQPVPIVQAAADLFKPDKPFVLPPAEAAPEIKPSESVDDAAPVEGQPAPTTTSRLLDAKRRAQKNPPPS